MEKEIDIFAVGTHVVWHRDCCEPTAGVIVKSISHDLVQVDFAKEGALDSDVFECHTNNLMLDESHPGDRRILLQRDLRRNQELVQQTRAALDLLEKEERTCRNRLCEQERTVRKIEDDFEAEDKSYIEILCANATKGLDLRQLQRMSGELVKMITIRMKEERK